MYRYLSCGSTAATAATLATTTAKPPPPTPPWGSQPACRARVYESPGQACDSMPACTPWGVGFGRCCGTTDAFCSSQSGSGAGDYVSGDAQAWVDLKR